MVVNRIYNVLQILEVEHLQLSNGWLQKFKLRHGLGFVNFHGEARSILPQEVEAKRGRLTTLLTSAF
jgi:hypothetical protein